MNPLLGFYSASKAMKYQVVLTVHKLKVSENFATFNKIHMKVSFWILLIYALCKTDWPMSLNIVVSILVKTCILTQFFTSNRSRFHFYKQENQWKIF